MKHHHEDHAPIVGLIIVLVILMIASFFVGAMFYEAVTDMGETMSEAAVITCDNRELVIAGCDKHGENCAPIHICRSDP